MRLRANGIHRPRERRPPRWRAVRSSRSARPTIGITSYPRSGKRRSFTVPEGYVDAVRHAGGIAVVLPPGERDAAELLGSIDGLVLSGGGDVAPTRYAAENHRAI